MDIRASNDQSYNNQTEEKTERPQSLSHDNHIDSLRVILTILVVLGHSTYYNLNSRYGGIFFADMMEANGLSDTVFHKIASIITTWIYYFHMPAFIFVSGLLYGREVQIGKYFRFKELVNKKSKRLLFPLLFVYFVWTVPVKIGAHFYDYCGFENVTKVSGASQKIRNIFLQLIDPFDTHMWFLESLFLCFIIAFIFGKVVKRYSLSNLAQLVVIGLFWAIGFYIQKKTNIQLLGNPLCWYPWFWLGEKYDELRSKAEHYNTAIQILAWGGTWY